MENYKTLLTAKIVGKTIEQVEVQRVKSVNVPEDSFVGEVRGSTVTHITRRANHLVY
jgi:formamidopyrimidine-DNA glycosylase